MAILNDCGEVFYAVLPACTPSFTVQIPGIKPDTPYQWYITDKFGHVYSESVITDANGAFVISADEFPEGYFNPYIGLLEFELKSNLYYCLPELFIICDRFYSQIIISFKEGNIPAVIPCLC